MRMGDEFGDGPLLTASDIWLVSMVIKGGGGSTVSCTITAGGSSSPWSLQSGDPSNPSVMRRKDNVYIYIIILKEFFSA